MYPPFEFLLYVSAALCHVLTWGWCCSFPLSVSLGVQPCWFGCVLPFRQTECSGAALRTAQWHRSNILRVNTAAVLCIQAHAQTFTLIPRLPPMLWCILFACDNVQVVNMQRLRGRGSRSRSIYTGKHKHICCNVSPGKHRRNSVILCL